MNSINCTVWLGDGAMGRVEWFGAPIIHGMSGLSLARHWHGVWGHMHSNNHSGAVGSCDRLLWCPALTLVRNRVCLLACRVCVIRCTTLLCRAILSPFMYRCSHTNNRWGHVSLSFL